MLLVVFAVVNVACLILRRDPAPAGAFRAPRLVPVVAAVACSFLAGPWARDRDDWVQCQIAGAMLVLGVVPWAITWSTNRGVRAQATGLRDIEHLEDQRLGGVGERLGRRR